MNETQAGSHCRELLRGCEQVIERLEQAYVKNQNVSRVTGDLARRLRALQKARAKRRISP